MPRSLDGTYCHACGGEMFIQPDGVSHHGRLGEISHDDDADHVAVADVEGAALGEGC
jgi:hypothetical protein